MEKTILNTDFIKIIHNQNGYIAYLKMSEGGWVEHNPFPDDIRGLVAALDLAINVCSGKVFLKGIQDGQKIARDIARINYDKKD